MAVDNLFGSVGNNFGNAFNIIGVTLMILMGVIVFGVIMYFLFREFQFKIPVVVHKVLGDGSIVEYKDRARKMFKKGNNEIRLKKFKETIPNPPADYYLKTGKGEKLYFRWDGTHVFVPQKVTYNSPLEFQPATYNILNQMAFRIRKSEERHKNKSFWEQYAPMILWVTFVVLIAVVLIVLFTKLELLGNSLNNIAEAIKTIEPKQVIQ